MREKNVSTKLSVAQENISYKSYQGLNNKVRGINQKKHIIDLQNDQVCYHQNFLSTILVRLCMR